MMGRSDHRKLGSLRRRNEQTTQLFVVCQESEDGRYIFNIYLHSGKTMFKFSVSFSQADIVRYEI